MEQIAASPRFRPPPAPDAIGARAPGWIDTPVGRLQVDVAGEVVTSIRWVEAGIGGNAAPGESPVLRAALAQLDAYFVGRLRDFDLPLAPAGSPFEHAVWDLMCSIPWGRTMTYGEMADALGGTARAVGGACGSNPIPVVIPCHRVLGAGDRMTGYSGRGGVETKRRLLMLEGALLI